VASLNGVKADAAAIEVTIRQQQMLHLMVNEVRVMPCLFVSMTPDREGT
jgi:hypothetical protein